MVESLVEVVESVVLRVFKVVLGVDCVTCLLAIDQLTKVQRFSLLVRVLEEGKPGSIGLAYIFANLMIVCAYILVEGDDGGEGICLLHELEYVLVLFYD